MLDAIVWIFQNIALAYYNLFYALTHPQLWLAWIGGLDSPEAKQALMRFIYYGGSKEFFFAVFTLFLTYTAIGLWKNSLLWGAVRVLEGIANGVGRFFAWAGLLMVIQQIIIVFVQRIFVQADLTMGFGLGLDVTFTKDISWWAEGLKFYNAMVVALCVTYTFVQGGHVRVDLIYSAISYRARKMIDMLGSIFFMMPMAVVIWLYGWYFLWRHLVTPKPSASDTLERLLLKARALRWNVETISFSPNGFNAYFLFKVLLVAFAGLVFLQAIAFFYRSYLERKEGPESEGRYLDKDTLGEGEEIYEGTH